MKSAEREAEREGGGGQRFMPILSFILLAKVTGYT